MVLEMKETTEGDMYTSHLDVVFVFIFWQLGSFEHLILWQTWQFLLSS